MGKHHPYVDLHVLWNNGTILSEQRSELAKLALLGGADWTVWFDADMRFPIDTIERLLAHNKPIVMAGYPTRKPPAIEPTQYADDETTIRVYTEKSSTGLQEIASGGFGCVAVHRSVFESMDAPWFHIPWNEKELKFDCGEDIYFCRKARKAGHKIYLDHDLSKEIAHIGQYEFTYMEANAVRPKIEQLRAHRLKINGLT
jgi:GT2 family glycosyltransferase